MPEIIVSNMDILHLRIIRDNIIDFMKYASRRYAQKTGKLLDIAPQNHEGAKPYFNDNIIVHTFDINPQSGCTYIGDICQINSNIADNSYDYIVCTEVLEHTLQPFAAIAEIFRLLKPQGYLFLSTPFNFRLHGPLPDCWRFTEHGLRSLLSEFTICELTAIETENRTLMPIQYTVIAQKLTP